jgi:predicted transcriptional regulator
MLEIRHVCLVPPGLVLLSHLKQEKKFQPIEYFVVVVALILFFYYRNYKEEKKVFPRKENCKEMMKEIKLTELKSRIQSLSSRNEDSLPIIRYSSSRIDSSIEIPESQSPNYLKQSTSVHVPFMTRSRTLGKAAVKVKDDSQMQRLVKHREEFIQLNEKIRSESIPDNSLDEIVKKFDPLMDNIIKYYAQLKSHKEEVKEKPKTPGAKTRIVVDPSEKLYQEDIQKKVELYKKSLEESKQHLDKESSTNIKGIVSQITSDVNDTTHLSGRIKALLEILRSLNPESLKSAIYVLCDAVVSRGLDQCDSIDIGASFSLNYTKFILTIAKSYRQIHEIYFIAVISRKYLFYPLVTEQNLEEIRKRSEIKDLSPSGKLNESEKDKLSRSLDLCRAFGFLIGSLFASKDSNFNEGDIWRYLAYILNLKIEYVDRAYMPFLLGFLKSSAGRLRCVYGKQFLKLVEFLAGDYAQSLQSKFGSNPYLRAYITQLRELLNKTREEIN